jgi:hypothetical protein
MVIETSTRGTLASLSFSGISRYPKGILYVYPNK